MQKLWKRLSRRATEPTVLSALSAEAVSDDQRKLPEGLSDQEKKFVARVSDDLKKLLEGLSVDEKKFLGRRTTLELLKDLRALEDLSVFEVERTMGLDSFDDLLKALEQQHGQSDCYTSVEWDEIHRSITPREVSHWAVIRFQLLRAARWYHWRKVFWDEKLVGNFKDDTAAWKKVSTLLQELKVALRDVRDPQLLLHDIEVAWCLSTDTKLAERAGISIDGSRGIKELIAQLLDRHDNVLDQIPDRVEQIDDKRLSLLIDLLIQNAEERAKRHEFGEFGEPRDEQCFNRVSKHHVIGLLYYRDLLRIWTKYIGGDLVTARDPNDGTPSGPLIRFLRAVTGPVMREEAPSSEALLKAVRREKRLRPNRRGLRTKCSLHNFYYYKAQATSAGAGQTKFFGRRTRSWKRRIKIAQ